MPPDGLSRATLLTGPGAGAIAVIRIRGPQVAPFLKQYFSRHVKARRCVHGELRDQHDEIIDDPVIVVHDDVTAEINLHGGPWIVASTHDLLRREGFEIIDAGDAPVPLEMADGAATIEREVAAWMPLARTDTALRMLLAQPAAWEEFVRSSPSPSAIQQVLSDRCLERLLHPPKVAIVGEPNVGKSTLANQLFAQERSITADLPGTTRDWVGELANLDGLAVMLIDTPGIRSSDDAIEQSAIEASHAVTRAADLVIVVIDASTAQSDADPLINQYPRALIVANKLDRAPAGFSTKAGALRTVATIGQGVDAVREAIRARLGCGDMSVDSPRWWTPRQREFLQQMMIEVRRCARS